MLKLGRYISLGGFLAMACFAPAWTTAAEDVASKVSDYLGADVYALLHEVETHDGTKVKRWIGPELSFANYKQVLIEDVILYPEPQPGPQISQETLDEVRAYLTEKLKIKVGAILKLTTEPGPQVIRMQVAITGVEITTEGMKVYEVMPVAAVFGGLKALTGTRDREVAVFVEGKLSDSVTGKMVGAAVRRLKGDKLKGTREQLKLEHLQDNLDTALNDLQGEFSDMLGKKD